jgi:excisionase family DNA binding protein
MPSSSRVVHVADTTPLPVLDAVLDVPVLDAVLDADEVAVILDCCNATVRREANRGRLRGVKVGSRWRFRLEAVDAYLDGETP